MEKNTDKFSLFANFVSSESGKWKTFCLAFLSIIVWLLAGVFLGFHHEWKEWAALYMSSVTFLLVFIIQHSHNRDTVALHLKLDELIRATHGAHTSLLKVEELSDDELDHLAEQYKGLADEARVNISGGKSDTHAPDMNLISNKKDGT